jgi:hypothetical protein
MRRILTITLGTLMLAACASTYDKSAVPAATTAMRQASDRCTAGRAAQELKTYSALEACSLAAQRAFLTSINLKKMDAFEDYAAAMQSLADDRDAGRVTDPQARSSADAILRRFIADCGCRPGDMPHGFVDVSGRFGPQPWLGTMGPAPVYNILGMRMY